MASEAIFGINLNRYNSNSQREGRWKFYWNISEAIYSEGCYKNDQKVGLWKYYDKKGNLTREELYIE